VGVTPVSAKSRIEASTHAVLLALDGQTGKTLWSSGDQIASWNHFSGITVANGRIYIGTYDGYEYCFGLGK
jgi:outer membrane protein assembly factor BamB